MYVMSFQMFEICFLLFIIYSFFGWTMEVMTQFYKNHRFINRGFLIGPYCSIYGFGALLITFLLQKYAHDPFTLFIMSILVCSLLEYITSWAMEKIIHARWWDYSNRIFNINGRICLETMIPFGILGVFLIYFANPLLYENLTVLPDVVIHFLTAILLTLFVIDNIVSFKIIMNFKKVATSIRKDSTEIITKKVREILTQKSKLYQRLLNSFPHMQAFHKKSKKQK